MVLCGARVLPPIVLSVAVLVLVSLSCSACVITPATDAWDDTPMEVATLEMWRDYQTNPVAAAAKYRGKNLHFTSVQVDQMTFLCDVTGGFYVQEGIDPNIEQVRFHAQDLADIISVREGYIVEIAGHDEGLGNGCVNIRIEWLRIIDPPGGATIPPPCT
ncbi:MAG: hypothetical protein FWH51_05855 [Dehalococcoidia bacterium]|nr:hypothetical protein [Dehalococcoidia bacterium]